MNPSCWGGPLLSAEVQCEPLKFGVGHPINFEWLNSVSRSCWCGSLQTSEVQREPLKSRVSHAINFERLQKELSSEWGVCPLRTSGVHRELLKFGVGVNPTPNVWFFHGVTVCYYMKKPEVGSGVYAHPELKEFTVNS